jgi:hypothetical protein
VVDEDGEVQKIGTEDECQAYIDRHPEEDLRIYEGEYWLGPKVDNS